MMGLTTINSTTTNYDNLAKRLINESLFKKKSVPKSKISDQLIDDIEKEIIAQEKEIMNNKSYMNKIYSAIDKCKKEFGDDDDDIKNYNKNDFKLVCEYEEDYFIIIDDHQYICEYLSFVIKDIANSLSKKFNNVSFSTGDGDEGCIYIK